MSRTLLPRGALSAYSAAVDHVLRVDESTCQPEGAVIGSDHGRSPIPGGLGASVRAASPYHDVVCRAAWCGLALSTPSK